MSKVFNKMALPVPRRWRRIARPLIVMACTVIGMGFWLRPSAMDLVIAVAFGVALFAFRILRWRAERGLFGEWWWLLILAPIPFAGHSKWIAGYVVLSGAFISLFLREAFRPRISRYYRNMKKRRDCAIHTVAT